MENHRTPSLNQTMMGALKVYECPKSFIRKEGHGVVIPGINDGFIGATPDDGAYEKGLPATPFSPPPVWPPAPLTVSTPKANS
jgi:hypothetical protein